MSEEIIKVLDDLCAKFGMAIDWTAENVQPYLLELFDRFVKYEVATSMFHIVLWFVLTLGALTVTLCTAPHAKRVNYNPSHLSSAILDFSALFTALFAVIFVLVTAFQVLDIITCYTLPEKILLNTLGILV